MKKIKEGDNNSHHPYYEFLGYDRPDQVPKDRSTKEIIEQRYAYYLHTHGVDQTHQSIKKDSPKKKKREKQDELRMKKQQRLKKYRDLIDTIALKTDMMRQEDEDLEKEQEQEQEKEKEQERYNLESNDYKEIGSNNSIDNNLKSNQSFYSNHNIQSNTNLISHYYLNSNNHLISTTNIQNNNYFKRRVNKKSTINLYSTTNLKSTTNIKNSNQNNQTNSISCVINSNNNIDNEQPVKRPSINKISSFQPRIQVRQPLLNLQRSQESTCKNAAQPNQNSNSFIQINTFFSNESFSQSPRNKQAIIHSLNQLPQEWETTQQTPKKQTTANNNKEEKKGVPIVKQILTRYGRINNKEGEEILNQMMTWRKEEDEQKVQDSEYFFSKMEEEKLRLIEKYSSIEKNSNQLKKILDLEKLNKKFFSKQKLNIEKMFRQEKEWDSAIGDAQNAQSNIDHILLTSRSRINSLKQVNANDPHIKKLYQTSANQTGFVYYDSSKQKIK